MIKDQTDNLWLYSNVAALLLAPLICLLLTFGLSLSYKYLGWPGDEYQKLQFIVVLVAGILPLILVLLDFLARRGVILSYKGLKTYFSGIDLSLADVR
jgi:hypothetical protein